MFIAVGHNGLRMRSADGQTWEDAQVGKEGEVYRAVAFGNGRFVAVGSYGGNNIQAATTDGKKWETASLDAGYVRYFRGLGFGDGRFLGIGGDPGSVGSSKPFVSTSTDGLKWSEYQSIPGKHILRRVTWGNDRFVAVGDRGRRAMSLDAVQWEEAPETKAIDTLVDIAYGNKAFVGVGLHGLRMSSEDGLAWSAPVRGFEGEHLNSIVFAEEKFVAIGAGATYISADGRAWERHANSKAPTTAIFGTISGKGVFVGALWKGQIVTSTDGITWQESHKNEHHLEAIAFGEL